MKPIPFKHSSVRLLPPRGKEYSDNVKGIEPMPAWSDGEQCVSCWRMSLKERLSALLFGRVWLALLSGASQPPASLSASRSYLREVGEEDSEG